MKTLKRLYSNLANQLPIIHNFRAALIRIIPIHKLEFGNSFFTPPPPPKKVFELMEMDGFGSSHINKSMLCQFKLQNKLPN